MSILIFADKKKLDKKKVNDKEKEYKNDNFIIIFSILNQLSFFSFRRFFISHNHNVIFFLFLFQKDFNIFLESFFCSFSSFFF